MRVLLVVNAHARRGREPIDPALEIFARAGLAVVRDDVPRARYVPDVIRRHAGAFDAVVLAGGDGTVHAGAEALMQAGRPVGILPRGTANDLARAVDLPLDLAAAAEVIVAGATRRIDVGYVNDRPFFNVAHIGLGATLASGLNSMLKRRFGAFAYTIAAARSLAGQRPFRAELAAGAERHAVRVYDISVGNGRFFGGNGVVAEEASIEDGLLHLFALKTRNPLRLMLLVPAVLSGRQARSKWVHGVTAPEIEVRTQRAMPIRADGKMVGETPATFRVRHAALTIFAPPREAPAAGTPQAE